MRARTVSLAAIIAFSTAATLPLTVSAHALPQSSIPAEGSSVQQSPPDVVITFGEPPDPNLSTITVVNISGTNVDAGPTVHLPGAALELETPLKPDLPAGVYTVTWKTVSSVDGHLATGSYAFGIGVAADAVPKPSPASSAAAPPSLVAVFMRLVLFTGVIVVLGAVVLGAFAFGAPTLAMRRVIAAGAVAALVGTLGVMGAQVVAAGVTLPNLFGSTLGRSLVERGIPAVVLLGAGMVLLRGWHPRLTGIVAGASAVVAMGVDVLSSHANAESPMALNVMAQWLHIGAVGVWIGGLVALLFSVMGTPSEPKAHAARRLSTLAGIGLAVVAATGVFRAVIEVQTWSNLVSTAFGALVVLKIALILVLAGLGAVNRYRNIPRVPHALRSLRRIVTTEVLVAFGALTVAAALVNVAPPAEYGVSAATRQPASVVVSGSDFATTVRVRLVITPGTAGFNTFNLRVTDYDTGAAVGASRVTMQLTQPLRPNLGSSTLVLQKQRDGSFQGRGGNVSLAGIWEAAVIVENGDRSTEVHLQFATGGPAPVVTSSRFNGLPLTLFTVQLGMGRSAQVYIDPNTAGAVEFHVTYFAGFGELQVSDAIIGETVPGGMPTILVARRFDPTGHFIADATIPAGRTRFDLIATLPGGEVLSTYMIITPGS